ncbi:MAG TPA: BON domain-containing protein [Pirellulales bacterium]|nr:BON domain-containing protein [Pirellulales bacterium]
MAEPQLADRIFSVLEQSPHVPHRNLRFETNRGQVTLHGVVRSYYQKQMAQEVLLGLEGVEHIENQLQVVGWAPPTTNVG